MTDSYVYYAFGSIRTSSGSTINPFRYVGKTGYYFEPDSLHYLVDSHLYNGEIGRFASPNTTLASVASAPGEVYVYASNSPIDRSAAPDPKKHVICNMTFKGKEGEQHGSCPASIKDPKTGKFEDSGWTDTYTAPSGQKQIIECRKEANGSYQFHFSIKTGIFGHGVLGWPTEYAQCTYDIGFNYQWPICDEKGYIIAAVNVNVGTCDPTLEDDPDPKKGKVVCRAKDKASVALAQWNWMKYMTQCSLNTDLSGDPVKALSDCISNLWRTDALLSKILCRYCDNKGGLQLGGPPKGNKDCIRIQSWPVPK